MPCDDACHRVHDACGAFPDRARANARRPLRRQPDGHRGRRRNPQRRHFQLNGTLGQPATAEIAAAGYRVYDGFWGPRSFRPTTFSATASIREGGSTMRSSVLALIALFAFGARNLQRKASASAFTYQGRTHRQRCARQRQLRFRVRAVHDAKRRHRDRHDRCRTSLSSRGLVNASIDFTDVPFNGQALFVEVRVRAGGSSGEFHGALSPRQSLARCRMRSMR